MKNRLYKFEKKCYNNMEWENSTFPEYENIIKEWFHSYGKKGFG